MNVHFQSGMVTLYHGDCVEVMRSLPEASVHSIVTDPPYGLEFMGKGWDAPWKAAGAVVRDPATERGGFQDGNGGNAYSRSRIEYGRGGAASTGFQEWCLTWAVEAFRVLKPGGHILAFGGSRTWHRLAAAVEDAGFEIRDSIAWLYGSGFPRSLDVSEAMEKRLAEADRGAPPAGAWGTALKPAFEPIVVGRKPFPGSVASNVMAHGTGALNIEGTRVGFTGGTATSPGAKPNGKNKVYGDGMGGMAQDPAFVSGRWPSNVVLDSSQAAELDRQSGVTVSVQRVGARTGKASGVLGTFAGQDGVTMGHADSGGASRFFPTFRYESKAPQFERPKGDDGVGHPTVKPLELMQWLVRLVTPHGGVVLEPFAGSGTTVEACLREGFSVIGIEREAEYLPLIMKRVGKDHQQSLFGDWDGVAS
ncbi:DNA-methyltransferase [Cryobacterium fucosi]|uniref:Methyltransferase n=1 Tax=Cryobacterium fucosi TaxID=1259157 RepID=A0A4R9B4V3_9MICO|nr:DNA methyltransferase [Cryobacterium fucosi]TFD74711.1 site-specific DNA-methyltransferase [Cryobacterium fucosi]